MSLITAGRNTRRMGTSALAGYADIDRKERALQTQLEAAQRGQDQAMLGTGASIGMQFGLPKAIDAYNAATSGGGTILTPSVDLGRVSDLAAGTKDVGAGLAKIDIGGSEAITNMVTGNPGPGLVNLENVATLGSEAAGIAAPVTEGVVAAETAAGGAEVVAGATEVAGGASTGSGFMAGLQSLATPVAIGLGVAFLLNKLFD